MTIIMLSPVPFKAFSLGSGSVYVADQFGIIPGVADGDQVEMTSAGCSTLSPNPTDLLGRLIGASFDSTADQVVAPFNGSVKYQVRRVAVMNASVSLSAAVGGLYPAPAKAGTPVVAGTQVYSGLTSPSKAIDLAVADATTVYPAGTPIYLSLTTPQGAPATGDLYVFGSPLPSP